MSNPRTLQEAILEQLNLRINSLKPLEFIPEVKFEIKRIIYLGSIVNGTADLYDDFRYPEFN